MGFCLFGCGGDDSVSENLSAIEFKKEMSGSDTIVIDVRTASEIANGKLAPDALELDFYAPDFREKLDALDRDKKYLIYCRSGNRSGQALKIMREMGFKNARHLEGGEISF